MTAFYQIEQRFTDNWRLGILRCSCLNNIIMARMKKLKPPKIDLKEKKQEKIARKLEAKQAKKRKGAR